MKEKKKFVLHVQEIVRNSSINADDMAEEIAEECEDASEAVNDFCDYGDNGFYFI